MELVKMGWTKGIHGFTVFTAHARPTFLLLRHNSG